jgi:hypothetical protein
MTQAVMRRKDRINPDRVERCMRDVRKGAELIGQCCRPNGHFGYLEGAPYCVAPKELILAVDPQALRDCLLMFQDCMDQFGQWDDGCFYYGGRSAPELQRAIAQATILLRAFDAE